MKRADSSRPSGVWAGRWRRRPLAGLLAAGTLLAPALAACGNGGASTESGVPVINWYIGAQGGGWIENAVSTCNEQNQGKFVIKFRELPARASDQREQLVRRLAADDASIDLIGMDVIWTAEFANAGWLTPYPEASRAKLSDGVLKGPLESGTYQGKLYAAPFTSNTQLLWYRKDLVDAPGADFTWDQMVDNAVKLKKLIQIQGTQAESITVTFNTLLESAGGTFVENANQGQDATIGLQEGPTVAALTALKKLATSSAADPELNTLNEDTSRAAFEQGNSAYEINYPFIYPSAAAVPGLQEKIGWARYPRLVAGKPSRPAARRLQHRDLESQQATGSRCRGGHLHRPTRQPGLRGGEGW